jgi:hypothetical protein
VASFPLTTIHFPLLFGHKKEKQTALLVSMPEFSHPVLIIPAIALLIRLLARALMRPAQIHPYYSTSRSLTVAARKKIFDRGRLDVPPDPCSRAERCVFLSMALPKSERGGNRTL